jgi:ABC-2 type transport system ATP-binding protein
MVKAEPVIEIRGLTKVFKDFWLRPRVTAIENLDLAIDAQQVFGLLGPNGSGKSTTIKIILGLLFPTKGRVAVFGKLPTDVSIKKRIGYLPEESYLYRFLNARETLDYYGRLFYIDRRERMKRIDELLEMVGLTGAQRRPVGEFSKGMQRRIGLSQALINNPDLLILDEPTTGLDPLGTAEIKRIILHLRDRRKTVILCSHLLADVEDVCNNLCILYGGKIRAQGTVDQLLTVSGKTVIETASLRPETISKIEQVISASEGKGIEKVHAPRQRLESLFLDIVQRAQREGAATSGARAGGQVADFLSTDREGAALIESLVGTTPAPGSAQAVTPVEPAVEQSVIAELTQPVQPETREAKPSAGKSEEVDRSVLDDLLGDKSS